MKKHIDLLNTLNALRAKLNKKALTEWKGTETELKAAITTAKTSVKALPTNSQAEDVANLKAKDKALTHKQKTTVKMAKDVAKKATTPKAKAQAEAIIKAATKADNKAEGKTDRFLGVAPKVARAKLRKAYGAAWKTKTASEIAAILKPTK